MAWRKSSEYRLEWDVRGKAPFNNVQCTAASVGDRAYFLCTYTAVAGMAPFGDKVYEYLSTTGQWQELPPCGLMKYMLANIRGKLTTVGGEHTEWVTVDCPLYWDEASRSWLRSSCPSIPISRWSPVIATTADYLIAAGGTVFQSDGEESAEESCSVMVLDMNTRLWSFVANLPDSTIAGSAAVCNGTVYVVSVHFPSIIYHCSLNALLRSTRLHRIWKVTKESHPIHNSILCTFDLVTVDSRLLSVVGHTGSVHMYDKKWFPIRDKMVHSGALTAQPVALPGGKVLVAVTTSSDTVEVVIGELLLISEFTAEEERHLEAFRAVIAEKGTLEQTIMHCLLFGYPGTGKSSLLKRLIGHLPDPTLPSTGVAEKAVQVEIRRLSTTTAMALHTTSQRGTVSKWYSLSCDDEAIALMCAATQRFTGQTAQPIDLSPTTSSQPVLIENETEIYPLSEDSSLITPIPITEAVGEVSNQPLLMEDSEIMESPSSANITAPSIHAHMQTMEVCKQAIERVGLGGMEQYLQQSFMLYITDTGGQLEFQELLPALTAGPTLFFLIFRLDQDLDKTVSIQFRYPDGHSTEPYQSSFTARETLLQSLASIASMGTYVYSKKQGEPVLLKPKVIFVGTHLDKVSSEQVQQIDCHLHKIVKATSLYHEGLIERVSESQLMVAVNNLLTEDSHFQNVQSIVERIAERDNFRVPLPSTWLIFSLVIRQLKKRVITYVECFAFAQRCGIDSQKELNEALWFLNTKVGLVRHFRGEGLEDLQDIVIVDPQVIFTMITRLIVSTFTDEHVTADVCYEFKSKGIFPRSVLERMSSDNEDYQLLTVDRFIKLLEHLHIISRLHSKKVQYFMPCTLAHAQSTAPEFTRSSSAAPSPDTQQIPPLLVTFRCGYCPKGLFSALVVYLLANKMKSELDWELQTERIFRNSISFFVGPYDATTLTLTPTYLELAMLPAEVEGERRLSVEAVCTEIMHCIEMAVRKVTSTLHYTSDAEHTLAFYCTGRHESELELHPAEIVFYHGEPCTVVCTDDWRKRKYKLPSGFRLWFSKMYQEQKSQESQGGLAHGSDSVRDGSVGAVALVSQQQQSPELAVFTKHIPTIRMGILHGVQHDIAHEAYAQGLISKAVHRTVTGALNRLTPDERTDLFMEELESRIRIDTTVLTKFVDLLKSSCYEALVRSITGALDATRAAVNQPPPPPPAEQGRQH